MSKKHEPKNHTTCPFCLYGCELAIVTSINNYVRNVEYLPDAKVNQGRLCPRGNAASIVLDDKKRLSYPIYQNKAINWNLALERITQTLKNIDKDEIAITFDKNFTEEELDLLSGLANELGIENFASSYLEPDYYFSYKAENCPNAKLSDIEKAKVFILIGDVFAQTPVISKPILNARYADRNNRIFAIDSIPTRTAGFADKFLLCRPGTEPLLILAMSTYLTGKIKGLEIETIAETCGVSVELIEEAAKTFSTINPGVVIGATNFGHQENPFLFALAGQVLTLKGGDNKKFLGIGEARSAFGKVEYGTIHNRIRQGKIKALLNFGDTFPFYYPQLESDMNQVDNRIVTNLFRPNYRTNWLVLPTASNLEKTGTIETLWGRAKITKTAEPVSGSKTIQAIIESVNQALGLAEKKGPRHQAKTITLREVYEQTREYLAMKKEAASNKAENLLLLGEKPAIGFLNIFDSENLIKINPIDCEKLNIKDDEIARVASEIQETELKVRKTEQIPIGMALVGVNRIENRKLFPMMIDKVSNNVIFPPSIIKIWRKELF